MALNLARGAFSACFNIETEPGIIAGVRIRADGKISHTYRVQQGDELRKGEEKAFTYPDSDKCGIEVPRAKPQLLERFCNDTNLSRMRYKFRHALHDMLMEQRAAQPETQKNWQGKQQGKGQTPRQGR